MGKPELPRMSPGSVVADRYVVIDHPGSGGMGDVYEVEHTLPHRRLALKWRSSTARTCTGGCATVPFLWI